MQTYFEDDQVSLFDQDTSAGLHIARAKLFDGNATRVGQRRFVGETAKAGRFQNTRRDGNNAKPLLAQLLCPAARQRAR